MAQEKVTVKFDGQSHQVDINTFTQVMLNYSTVLQASADAAGIEDNIKVYITATEQGSLDVIISIIAEGIKGALDFFRVNRDALESIVIIAGGVFALKKNLAGKKKIDSAIETGDKIEINADGDVTIVDKRVYSVYKNHPEATTAIDNAFEALEQNPEITGIEFTSNERTVFRAESNEFSAIAASPNYENENVQYREEDSWLTVVKPFLAFSKTRKWEFIYNGTKITAPVVDEVFLDSLEHVPFLVGTKMHVTLEIMQEYNDEYKAFMNKKFVVKQVIKVDNPPQTDPLF